MPMGNGELQAVNPAKHQECDPNLLETGHQPITALARCLTAMTLQQPEPPKDDMRMTVFMRSPGSPHSAG